MDKDVLNKLRRLNIEDIIWIIAIGVALMNFYSNYFEREYVKTNSKYAQNKFRKINVTILTITTLVSLYFTAVTYDDYKNSQNKEEFLLPLISNTLFLIGGAILLYSAVTSGNLDDTDAIF